MKKLVIILIVLVLGVGLVWVVFFSDQAQERKIKKAIINANYCQSVSDCQLVAQSQCPFGCYIHVNKKEADQIMNLLENYQSKCAYVCIPFIGVECVDNRCQIKQSL